MIFISSDSFRREESRQVVKIKIWELWKFCNFEPRAEKRVFFSVLASQTLWYQFFMHTGPETNTNKTQTSRFTWFPKIGYVHGGSRLYIIGGIIQTLNSIPIQSQNPVFHSTLGVSLKSVFFFTLLHTLLSLALHFFFCTLYCTLFIREMEGLGSSSPCEEPTTTMTKVMVVVDGWWRKVDNCYMIIVI